MLYKMSAWQGGSGKWYCNNIDRLAGATGKWWAPARFLHMSLEDYILMLFNDFDIDDASYFIKTDCLIYSWNKESKCKKFVSWINKQAKQHNWNI